MVFYEISFLPLLNSFFCAIFVGPLARSNTFSSSSLKPKVKHLRDQMFHKQKVTKGIGSHDGKKEGSSQKMDRSVSFKSTSSRYADASDSKLKEQPSPQDSKFPKFYNDKYPLERRSSFKSDNHSVSSLPSVLNSTSAMKSIQPSMASNKGYAAISSGITIQVTFTLLVHYIL